MLSLCLGWTSWASAADLVEFMGRDTDFEHSVKSRAAYVAQDEWQLGFVSRVKMQVLTGEFSVDVADTGTQVAVLSDDGVSVQVTDMGDIDNPLGSGTQIPPGLAHFGEGQDLPTLGQSLKQIPVVLTANHRYRFDWQYRNTYHTSASDLDGMKVFVFGGNAQLALAGDTAFLSPNDVNGKTWDQVASITPPATTLVFPGKTITLDVEIHESDSYRVLAGGVFGARQSVPFVLDAEEKSGVSATITLLHAQFDTGGTEKTFPFTYYSGKLLIIPKPRIVVDQNLSATQKVKATIVVTDPGRPPAAIPGISFVPGYGVKDPDITTLSVSWSRVPTGTVAPVQVRGFVQINIPPEAGYDGRPFKNFDGRDMRIVYQYFPDLNGATEAANYDGLPVLETFSPLTVTIANKSMALVQDNIVTRLGKPGDTVDTLFTRWMEPRSQKDATFTIFSYPTAETPTFDLT